MYTIIKRIEVSSSHKLNLNYESKCTNLHGHNWLIKIHCRSQELNENGMVIDFTHVKKLIQDQLDHKNLNDYIEQPTAENIAKWIYDQINTCYKVEVIESEGNYASYENV